MAREDAIELTRELILVAGAQRRRAAGVDAASAQLVQEVAPRNVFADVGVGVQLASEIESHAARLDDQRGKWNVRGDDHVAGGHPGNDLAIRDVESARDLNRPDPGGGRRRQPSIGHQRHRNPNTRCCKQQDVLDDRRAGVGIDPDLHPRIVAHANAHARRFQRALVCTHWRNATSWH